MLPPPQPQSHNLSRRDEKPTRFAVGWSSAFPTNGPEPNQLTRGPEAEGLVDEGLADGTAAGLLGLGVAGPGAVSRHCCHSQARPSNMGLRCAGGGGGGCVVVFLAFGVTTTWLSKAYNIIMSNIDDNDK